MTVLGVVKNPDNSNNIADSAKPSLLNLPPEILSHIGSFIPANAADFSKPIRYDITALHQIDYSGIAELFDDLTI